VPGGKAPAAPDTIDLFNDFPRVQADIGQQFHGGNKRVNRTIIPCLLRLEFGKVLFREGMQTGLLHLAYFTFSSAFFEFDANSGHY